MGWIWYLLIPILLYISLVLYKDWQCLKRMDTYTKQGFHKFFVPFFGGYFLFTSSPKNPQDGVAALKEKVQEIQDKEPFCPGIVANSNFTNTAMVILTDPKIIREFFLKEVEVAVRSPIIELPVKFPFFWENSAEALHKRTIFSEFFRVDNLSSCIPDIRQACLDNVARVKELIQSKGQDGAVTLDAKFEMVKWIQCITENTLFANKNHKVSIHGKMVSETIYEIFQIVNSYRGTYHITNFFGYGIFTKFHLYPIVNKAMKLYNEAKEIIKQTYRDRTALPAKDLHTGILDLMVKYNREEREFPLSEEDAVGYMIVFLFAGVDTTSRTLQSALYCLAKDPILQQKIRDEVRIARLDHPGINFQDLEKSPSLHGLFRETLRLYDPASMTFERVFVKDFNLGQYEFKKGDRVLIPLAGMMAAKSCTINPEKFDVTRHLPDTTAEKKVNPQCYMPFSLGKRNCVGQILAEVEFKVAILTLLSNFEISLPPSTPAKGPDSAAWELSPLYEIKQLDLVFRLAK